MLSIGQNIKDLRKDKNLTQENLASHLSVSAQSVSKWERGEGYPDIEMLPGIANYFGVSIDSLIGMSEKDKRLRYEQINELWEKNNSLGCNEENVSLMRHALQIFPNDALLLVQLSTSLEKLDGAEGEAGNNIRESIAAQEQIIDYCEDSEIRAATLFNICFSYWKIGEMEKAVECAEKLPNIYKTRENALVRFLKGERRVEVAREALDALAWSIGWQMRALTEETGNPIYEQRGKEAAELLRSCI